MTSLLSTPLSVRELQTSSSVVDDDSATTVRVSSVSRSLLSYFGTRHTEVQRVLSRGLTPARWKGWVLFGEFFGPSPRSHVSKTGPESGRRLSPTPERLKTELGPGPFRLTDNRISRSFPTYLSINVSVVSQTDLSGRIDVRRAVGRGTRITALGVLSDKSSW